MSINIVIDFFEINLGNKFTNELKNEVHKLVETNFDNFETTFVDELMKIKISMKLKKECVQIVSKYLDF